MTYKPIRCDLYDYIEIACMHRYLLSVELLDGSHVQGFASDTLIKNKIEFLVIKTNHKKHTIQLDKIRQFTALNKHAAFKTIYLEGSSE